MLTFYLPLSFSLAGNGVSQRLIVHSIARKCAVDLWIVWDMGYGDGLFITGSNSMET